MNAETKRFTSIESTSRPSETHKMTEANWAHKNQVSTKGAEIITPSH